MNVDSDQLTGLEFVGSGTGDGTVFAVLNTASESRLFTVNLTTGAATEVNGVGNGLIGALGDVHDLALDLTTI